ncbi:MerR family transcriptional regulator [Paenibacillus thalictri]|uniref:MerR family transcriptional regulator n=1 Tax=Paenibacillus thalictri TaxID=2527873 RepID=A0A4Q9DHN4_9BACL|nr:MerR family transcriptional regulator [Paenibacillus thalictri]TBL69322.1 MerR family transcriptional regulator [Paenibacillus thalictri]
MEHYKIDDVAKECGLTKRTIRYYEEIGILPPPERSEGGIRLYTREHIERLKRLINARDVLGFSLQEVQKYIAIVDELESHRRGYHGYKEVADKAQMKLKLQEIEQAVAKQAHILQEKLAKMIEINNQIAQYQERIKNALANFDSDMGQ